MLIGNFQGLAVFVSPQSLGTTFIQGYQLDNNTTKPRWRAFKLLSNKITQTMRLYAVLLLMKLHDEVIVSLICEDKMPL